MHIFEYISLVPPADATAPSSMNGNNNGQTLVISVSAAIIGFLLLLVMITLLGLICVVVWKRKSCPPPEHSYRPQTSPSRRNTYESRAPLESKVPREEDLKKQELELGALTRPEPPTDPEYATITEWRQMNRLRSSSQEQMGVTNPFYVSTDFLGITKTKTNNVSSTTTTPTPSVDVLKGSFTPDPAPKARDMAYSHQNSCMAYSLQDVRSTGLKLGPEGTQGSAGLAGLTGSAGLAGNSRLATGQPTQTLAGGYNSRSTHNIPLRTVQRHVSMKAEISTSTTAGPVVAPHPNRVKRNVSMKALGSGAEDSHTPLSGHTTSGYLAPMNSHHVPLSGHAPPSGLHAHSSGHTPPASDHHSPMRGLSQQMCQSSPLTHSIRDVKGGEEVAGSTVVSKEEEDEDIGNDNYMIVSKIK